MQVKLYVLRKQQSSASKLVKDFICQTSNEIEREQSSFFSNDNLCQTENLLMF